MKLYRYLSEKELQLILQGKLDDIGMEYSGEISLSNTHRYKKGKRYLHFFFRKFDCEYMKKMYEMEKIRKQTYIAEFKIPLKRILGHIGIGVYYPLKGGYKYGCEEIHELSLPVEKFDPKWLIAYEKVQNTSEEEKSQPK